MNQISEFRLSRESGFAGWICDGEVIKKQFEGHILAVELKSKQRVLILQLKRERDNVAVYDSRGLEIRTVRNPIERAICFGDAYYLGDELTLFARTRDAEMFACVIDEDGNVLRTYEAR